MDKSLFQYIWKHSKRDQIILLIVTVVTFPLLYLTLEIPKRIINDAIGGTGEPIDVLGVSLTQVQFLMLLCMGFLGAVLVNGLVKMRLNTMKGVLAERLLRRLRYQLVHRLSRYPKPYFRTTSQGELVSMVTSEAEPMGGLMGDLISQPVFQAGQMATILFFLFLQSFWFGLASIALIPLQAWLIPKLQRQINLLNKDRIQEVRKLSSDIGETAAGVSDLRTNGGLRLRMSMFSDRLGTLFGIRFQIYQKKYFMKFLNNFINQLTPFFFYSVGGYLAIRGEITVGALVAALSAYKDLSSPWKELLAYYNTTQDMATRWVVMTEKFSSSGLVDDALLDGAAESVPRLNGEIELKDVTVEDEDGQAILEDISMKLPAGGRVAIKVNSETAALALADVLTREVLPRRGTVTVAGQDLNELHQDVIASRIGYAHSKPYIFRGSLGENLMMPFKHMPLINGHMPRELEDWRVEAERAGNSLDPYAADWLDPKVAGFETPGEIHDWWFKLVQAMGIDDFMIRRALRSRIDVEAQEELTEAVVKLRPEIERRLKEAGLDKFIWRYNPDEYNPVSPLGSNLLFALPRRPLPQGELSRAVGFVGLLERFGILEEMANISASVVSGLVDAFGVDAMHHPLFRKLNLDEQLYLKLVDIVQARRRVGDDGIPREDLALLTTVPFAFSAEQIGTSFTQEFKDKVLELRKNHAAEMVAELDGLFQPLCPETYFPIMTLMGNAIYGRISEIAGAREEEIEQIVATVLQENGLSRQVAQSIFSLETTQGGENLPAVFRERMAFSRAGIKRPDVLILSNALASHDSDQRKLMRDRVSDLMPETTKIFIENDILDPDSYDLYVEIVDGRIAGTQTADLPVEDAARSDLTKKMKILGENKLLGTLDLRQQKILAYSSKWMEVKAGETIFTAGAPADAAYICVTGKAGLYFNNSPDSPEVTEVVPGRLIGDLAVIKQDTRLFTLKTKEDSVFLRLGGEELLSVIEGDGIVASNFLRVVADHLTEAADRVRQLRELAEAGGVDLTEFEAQR